MPEALPPTVHLGSRNRWMRSDHLRILPRRLRARDVAGLMALLLLLGLSIFSLLRYPSADGFVVSSATLSDPKDVPVRAVEDPLDDAFGSVRPHRVTAGDDIVVGYRWWSPGGFAIDDEEFEKITVAVKRESLTDQGQLEIGSASGVPVAYTRGGSAWPRSACFGWAESGTVRFRQGWFGRWTVELEFDVHTHSPRGRDCGVSRIKKSFTASPRILGTLTPWEGRAGEHPYLETYRS